MSIVIPGNGPQDERYVTKKKFWVISFKVWAIVWLSVIGIVIVLAILRIF